MIIIEGFPGDSVGQYIRQPVLVINTGVHSSRLVTIPGNATHLCSPEEGQVGCIVSDGFICLNGCSGNVFRICRLLAELFKLCTDNGLSLYFNDNQSVILKAISSWTWGERGGGRLSPTTLRFGHFHD